MKPPFEHEMRFSNKTQCWQSGYDAGASSALKLADLVKQLAGAWESEENGNSPKPGFSILLRQAYASAKQIKNASKP